MEAPKVKWHVHRRPRMSANEWAEYMAADDKPRETIARDAKYARVAAVTQHKDARRAISRFLASTTRDFGILYQAKESLIERANQTDLHPVKRDGILRNILAIDAFERAYNSIGLAGHNIRLAPIGQEKLLIEGLKISVNLDLLIKSRDRKGDLAGGILLQMARGQSGSTDAAKRKRERMGLHASALVHMHVAQNFLSEGRASFKHCFWVNVQRQESVSAPTNYKSLITNMQAAARVVVAKWHDIEPPPGFDPALAAYRN